MRADVFSMLRHGRRRGGADGRDARLAAGAAPAEQDRTVIGAAVTAAPRPNSMVGVLSVGVAAVIEARPGVDGTVMITFRVPCAADAERISVVGEFNGWSTVANPMERGEDGFVARMSLPIGRVYRFRYLLDGWRWQNDWAADAYVDNEFGGDDSVIDLTVNGSRARMVHADAPDDR